MGYSCAPFLQLAGGEGEIWQQSMARGAVAVAEVERHGPTLLWQGVNPQGLGNPGVYHDKGSGSSLPPYTLYNHSYLCKAGIQHCNSDLETFCLCLAHILHKQK